MSAADNSTNARRIDIDQDIFCDNTPIINQKASCEQLYG